MANSTPGHIDRAKLAQVGTVNERLTTGPPHIVAELAVRDLKTLSRLSKLAPARTRDRGRTTAMMAVSELDVEAA